jgi:MtN3 and saliva related transmembrane protein
MMPPAVVDAVGAAGAALTTLCWVPQAMKIIRERETRAISLPGTALCVLGVLLWLVYGIAITDGPLIGSSLVTFAMTGVILVLKIRHGWARKATAHGAAELSAAAPEDVAATAAAAAQR